LFLTIIGGLFYILFAAIFVVTPTAMIVVGSKMKDDCPSKPRLPSWMVTQGVICLIWCVVMLTSKRIRAGMEERLRAQYGDHIARDDINRMADLQFRQEHRPLTQIYNLVQGFGLIWFMMGSIWTFGCPDCHIDYVANASATIDPTGCAAAAFQLAYWFLLSIYIISGLPFLIFALWVCGFCFYNNGPTDN
jgi:hypothetical protein